MINSERLPSVPTRARTSSSNKFGRECADRSAAPVRRDAVREPQSHGVAAAYAEHYEPEVPETYPSGM